MITVMKEHFARYPKMQINDVFKLIYQSEFGGGHMIEDKDKSLEWIQKEAEFIKNQQPVVHEAFCEDIGDGMCRIYLEVLEEGLAPETLNEMFVLSANIKRGSITSFEAKLEQFIELCKGELPFRVDEVRNQIAVWKAAGYPAMHHSEEYRENYVPAYRVVEKRFAERWKVLCEIDEGLRTSNTGKAYVVAIDGMAGSGKSVMGQVLKEIYQCNLFHMDDFFLQPHQRTPERLSEPGGNVDYERFKTEVLDCLDDKEGFWYQPYDCSVQHLAEKQRFDYTDMVIIEGSYSLHPYFEERADIGFFMEVPAEVQVERIRNRNGEWLLKRFVEEWIPKENTYFETFAIKEKAIQV